MSILEEKKGEDIVLLDIKEVSYFADYFVICTGTTDRMIKALLEDVVRQMRADHRLRPRIEGLPDEGWMLADFGDVILHLFYPDLRDYYQLEELWSEAKVLVRLQ